MKNLRSYDGLVTLAWVCVVVAAGAIREVALSDDVLMVGQAHGVVVAAFVLSPLLVYLAWKMKRRAENKVRMSGLILLTDIQILAKSNSQLLDDAIALRYAQMEQGRNSGD